MRVDSRQCPVREELLLTVYTFEYSKSLEGDRGRERVRRCRLLMSFQEGLEGDVVGIECDGAAFN